MNLYCAAIWWMIMKYCPVKSQFFRVHIFNPQFIAPTKMATQIWPMFTLGIMFNKSINLTCEPKIYCDYTNTRNCGNKFHNGMLISKVQSTVKHRSRCSSLKRNCFYKYNFEHDRSRSRSTRLRYNKNYKLYQISKCTIY